MFVHFKSLLTRKVSACACCASILLLFTTSTVSANKDDSADKLETSVDNSNPIVVTVPFLPGGGTDIWARAVLPNLDKFLPGNPKLVIENITGIRGHRAANDYARSNPLHGKSLLTMAASMNIAYLLEDERIHYDLSDWRALMAYNSGIVVYGSVQSGIEGISDLVDSEQFLIMASIGPTSEDLLVLLAFDILEIDITSIFGLTGRGAARRMFENGDVNVDFQTTPAFTKFVKPAVDVRKAIPLFSLGAFDSEMNYVRDPLFPDLPNLAEVYKDIFGVAPQSEAWKAWMSIYKACKGTLKFLVIPEATPEEIMASYQNAINNMLKDQAMLDTFNIKLGKNTIYGPDNAQKLMEEMIALPVETRNWLKQWIFERYQIKV